MLGRKVGGGARAAEILRQRRRNCNRRVVGGGVWRAWDQGVFSVGEGPAYEPWKDWRKTGNDAPLALVRAAILAASPHNTQPWLFKITNSSIELHIDTQRNVGALDPYLREEHIGI